MAKNENHWFKGVRGRIGNMIFYEVNNESRVRTAPTQYRDANTPQQQKNRAIFGTAVRFYQRLKETPLKVIWKTAGLPLSIDGYALFMKTNLKLFKENGSIGNFPEFKLSVGTLAQAPEMTAEIDLKDNVTLRWENNGGRFSAHDKDRLAVVVLYGNRSFTPLFIENLNATRGDEHALFRLSREKEIAAHVYCFFTAHDATAYSPNQYFKL